MFTTASLLLWPLVNAWLNGHLFFYENQHIPATST